MHRKRTILFVDEIHRFTRAQQDAFLPHVEDGTITLIGATTENPSFEVNAALLSRCRVVTLRGLTEEEVGAMLDRAVASPSGLKGEVTLAPEAREALARYAYGDGRRALNAVEVAAAAVRLAGPDVIDRADAEEALQQKTLLYDKAGEEHYNVVSAFIKSLRGSDPDAAVYYMVRMLEGGEEPRFVLRRMVIFASEDVGNADPQALQLAVAALQALRARRAAGGGAADVAGGHLPGARPQVERRRSPPTPPRAGSSGNAARCRCRSSCATRRPSMMKGMGYGGGYRYPHDFDGSYVVEEYLPDALRGERIVKLSENGLERALGERWKALREKLDEGDALPPRLRLRTPAPPRRSTSRRASPAIGGGSRSPT